MTEEQKQAYIDDAQIITQQEINREISMQWVKESMYDIFQWSLVVIATGFVVWVVL